MWERTTIVVGAGSAGGLLAARLSEQPGRRVVLLEAGPDYPDLAALPAPLRDRFNPDLTSHDWGFSAFYVEPKEARAPVPYPRGRLVGGSSATNGSVAVRGLPADYDDWAALGNQGWSHADVLPYLVRLERDLDFAAPYHGADGPIPIRRTPLAQLPEPYHAFLASCRALGFPECPDHNAPGSTGVGPMPRNELGELRASTLVTTINPARDRPNLELRPDTHVTRVLLEGARAVGVEAVGALGVERIEGSEVVLCAGAIGSPQILFHSGIGPRETLARVGIDCLVDLPGVGRSLRDHPLAPFVALFPPGADWQPAGFSLLLKTHSSQRRNDLFLLAAVISTTSLNYGTPPGVTTAFTLAEVVARPHSTGWLEPRSADPLEPPEIHMGFLTDPRDRAALAEVARLGHAIAATPPLADLLGEIVLPQAATLADDDELERWLLEHVSTGYHAVGTCRMGPPSDPLAVVDPELRVRGVEGLVVADASIMPDITSGLTNVTAFMIGERAADLLSTVD